MARICQQVASPIMQWIPYLSIMLNNIYLILFTIGTSSLGSIIIYLNGGFNTSLFTALSTFVHNKEVIIATGISIAIISFIGGFLFIPTKVSENK